MWVPARTNGLRNTKAASVANFENSPVDADHTQRHDGGSAAHYIHADEDVAERVPKKPLAPGEVRHYHKRHHNYGHRQVRHCQGHQQVVWRLPQLLHHAHRDHHQRVPHHGDRRDDRQHHPDDDLLRAPEILQLLPARLVPHGCGTGGEGVVEKLHGAIDNFGNILLLVKSELNSRSIVHHDNVVSVGVQGTPRQCTPITRIFGYV